MQVISIVSVVAIGEDSNLATFAGMLSGRLTRYSPLQT
jgi:hypothetical protein